MPRNLRKKSSTGIYHVVFRGINRQIIFEDNEDYRKFLFTLIDCKEKSGFKIFAYCLMSNHIHLLIKEEGESLGVAFRRLGASYVYWYNLKYSRKGHLFQDRFKSGVVEDNRYFLEVLRYIHQNPVKAGLVNDPGDFRWSSYREYLMPFNNKYNLCEKNFVLKIFSWNLTSFKEHSMQACDDEIINSNGKNRLNDMQASKTIENIAGLNAPAELQTFEKENRDMLLKKFKAVGIPMKQIARVTGISYGIIRRL